MTVALKIAFWAASHPDEVKAIVDAVHSAKTAVTDESPSKTGE